MGNAMTDADHDEWKATHATVLQYIAEGVHLSEQQLDHWRKYCESRLARGQTLHKHWRHKVSGDVYRLAEEPLSFHVSGDVPITNVLFWPERSQGLAVTMPFSRDIDQFLDKFEMVRKKEVWEEA